MKKPFREHKKLLNILNVLNTEQLQSFDNSYNTHINKLEFTISKMFRMCESLIDIITHNINNHEKLFLEYINSRSAKRKLQLRYGDARLLDYTTKLKNRDRPQKPHSIFDYRFWMQRGLSEIDSRKKVTEIQKENVKKRTKHSYKNFSEKIKYSVDYWLKLGYSLEESEILRKPYLDLMKNDLTTLIHKYGEEDGTNLWIKRCEKYKETMSKNLCNRRVAGYVSKESLRFFIPLYKFCRRLGIKRKEIYFGISGSREFFIRDDSLLKNGGKFYDFCIPKLDVIIEYHGTFWHTRKVEEWRNPWMDYDVVDTNDLYKITLAKQRNMEYHIVWSDDDLNSRYNEMCVLIRNKINES